MCVCVCACVCVCVFVCVCVCACVCVCDREDSMSASSSEVCCTLVPLYASSISPASMPATAAGDPGATLIETRGGDGQACREGTLVRVGLGVLHLPLLQPQELEEGVLC